MLQYEDVINILNEIDPEIENIEDILNNIRKELDLYDIYAITPNPEFLKNILQSFKNYIDTKEGIIEDTSIINIIKIMLKNLDSKNEKDIEKRKKILLTILRSLRQLNMMDAIEYAEALARGESVRIPNIPSISNTDELLNYLSKRMKFKPEIKQELIPLVLKYGGMYVKKSYSSDEITLRTIKYLIKGIRGTSINMPKISNIESLIYLVYYKLLPYSVIMHSLSAISERLNISLKLFKFDFVIVVFI